MGERNVTPLDAAALGNWQSRRVEAWGRVFVAAIVLTLLVVLGRVVQLQVAPEPRLAEAAGVPRSSKPVLARRGDLLDRRGRLLAASSIGYRLFVDPQLVEDPQTVALDIARAIGEDPIAIDRRLQPRLDRRYAVVEPLLDDVQVEGIRAAALRGVGLEPRPVRHYPHGDVGVALIGTVGFENTGLSGLEHRFDDAMASHLGRLTYLRDVGRHPLWVEPADYDPGERGTDVRLSIDLVIQGIAERRLAEAVEEFGARGGRIVVMDPRTGELLAMHDVLKTARESGADESAAPAGSGALRRNRCITDPYEPGSTFKPFVWSRATQLGRASPDEVLPTPEGGGYRTPYGRLIRDSHYYGPSTWRMVLVKSLNSGMAMVAERLTRDELRSVVHDFGFGQTTGCRLPGESRGIVTARRDWSRVTQSSVAMGHEIAVTPVQMVRAFSAFARDGTMPPLRITAMTDADERYRFLRRAVPERIARLTREVLHDVMLQGTGRRAQSDRYQLFGKSGTAQLPRPDGGGYYEDRFVSSFIAGAPFDHPRIVVLCVLDDPDHSKGHLGGTVAGPAVRDVIEEVLDYLGVEGTSGPHLR